MSAMGAALTAVALLLCGCGGTSGRTSSPLAPARPVPEAPAHARPPSPSSPVTGLRRELTDQLRRAGRASGAAVYDLTDGRWLFGLRAGVRRPPASVEKLYTSVALLRTLGPRARLRTRLLAAGRIDAHGVLHGNLYLKGGGDPTFGDDAFNRIWTRGLGASSAVLARRLAAGGLRAVSGHLIADASLYDAARGGPASGLAADIPDFGGQLSALTYDHGASSGLLSPGAFAARQMALTLRDVGIRAVPAPGLASAPHGARQLAEVPSPPLRQLLALMNVPSDDLYAEMLTKQLGARYSGEGTTAAGARQISTQIQTLGLRPAVVDGSGLSRHNSSSPAEVVTLLRAVWHTSDGRALADSLPVLGKTGTARRIGVRTAAQGRCVGKTGTLNYVTNLAGLCRARSGHTIAYAVFIDGPGTQPALTLISRMAGAIATLR